jgi:hypothetical protein
VCGAPGALQTGVVFSMSRFSWFRRDGANLAGPLQHPRA